MSNSANCPICGNAAWAQDRLAGRILGLPDRFCILACRVCGQRRLDPPLSEAEVKDIYSGAYFSSDEKAPSSLPSFSERADDAAALFAGRQGKFTETVQNLKKLHPQARTVLDVGAATGAFVKVAREHGLQADGIEYSAYAVQQAMELYGIRLEQATLEQVPEDRKYDIIHLNHVFEHFTDPVHELRHILRLLRNGGILYVEIPYQFHAFEKLSFILQRRRASFGLHSLHHPYFYTPVTILRLLESQGLDVTSVSVFSPSRYDAPTLLGKCKKSMWWLLSTGRIGNHIEIIARRSS